MSGGGDLTSAPVGEPITYDLGALATAIDEKGSYRRFGGLIRRAISLHSLYVDLDTAADTLATLADEPRPTEHVDESRQAAREAAMLHSAIVLYARATKSTSRERVGFDIRSRLSPEERTVHAEICDLRDHAVAHFGSGGSYTGQWKAETAILQIDPDGFRVGVVTRRTTFDSSLIKRIERQNLRAREIVGQVYEAKIGEVTEAFSALAGDPNFVRMFSQHPIDLRDWLQSHEAAAGVLSKGKLHKGAVHR